MSKETRLPIVGVGASAGGIPAMESLFKGLPDSPGMAFVVVTHLSPERESLLHDVLRRYTAMPVMIAEDGMEAEPDNVYVMPQNAVLTIKSGKLQIRHPRAASRERKPIDIFFSSLAEDQGEYGVGIILSGGDGDGTLGAKMLKEHGGFVLAQASDGSGPRNPDMPQSAISSGVVDIAVGADEMGEKLIDFARSFDVLEPLMENDGEEPSEDIDRAREEIYGILRAHSGHDFSGYKSKTFIRRVKRRMQIGQMKSLSGYIDLLRKDAREITALFRDLLINVTNFFRDVEAFELLEKKVIPQLFEGKTASDTVRVWVPGCATGEEVFSLGMLLREHMDTLSVVPKIQIFATDIDEPALTVARAARYPVNLLDSVSAERRQRFFTNEGDSFVLTSEVRELCIFSPHSVIKDPPFSRMDMVSCRNLLIYFGPDIQNRVIPIFHYALKPSGYLFLGTSESIGQHGDLFAAVDKKRRIFKAREDVPPRSRLPLLIGDGGRAIPFPSEGRQGRNDGIAGYPLRQAVESQVIERHAPPHVVVNAEGDVVYYSARTGRYLEPPQGAPNRNLLSMARQGLRLDLRAALREAVTTRQIVLRENIAVDAEDERVQFVSVTVEPLPERGTGEPFYLVLFQSAGPARDKSEVERERGNPDDIAHLERDIRETRERLQSTIEEYETALEEVKSSNEELVSLNEEAQSTNEELEASKEEMQSLNEELNTINAELSGKIEELDHANSDLKNLFECTEIATVFLDSDLVIRSFTPAASSFFNLRASDVGRPLTELSSQLDYPQMRGHIEQVFETGDPVIHHLARDVRGRYYMVRLIPYRDKGACIQGVVVTLVDVTPLAEAEEHQKVLISELNHRVKNMLAVVTSITNRTVETASTKEEFATALLGRLHAMSRAYGVLSRENWTEVSIEELIGQEAAPFGPQRFSLDGPAVKLKPQQALSLSMVMHELATNAAKYGALSKEGGRVDVEWLVDDHSLRLVWKEVDGPPVAQPKHGGFGLSLVKGEIEYRLSGTAETFFERTGLKVRIKFPLDKKA
ncbi:putative PAS/PAC sensor protein [Mesorhizobium metallidurans STM 2683]|uniref:histidine kinase n=1 Tax=Mesorhizobium metallidurans STM 2683 TaxID=1297569 RepID=M5F1I1_9HYPH|nr:CheR family methyltransferase [Mesorhizobium metallidurans]CCV05671.1 putative PAS/PAC sensor protein [Mesorhizobium metallidurans STM 2683]